MTASGPRSGAVSENPAALAHVNRDTARRVVPLFRPYRAQVAAVVGLIVVTSTIGIINPLLIQVVFNKALFVPGRPEPPAARHPDRHHGRCPDRQWRHRHPADLRDHPGRAASHAGPTRPALLAPADAAARLLHRHQDRRDSVPPGQRRGWCPVSGHHHRLDHPGQRCHLRIHHRRHAHPQLAANHRGGHYRAGVFLADQDGRRAAPPGGALDPGVAGGDERSQRGNPVGVRGAAGEGVRQPGARRHPLPRGEPAPGRPGSPPADDRPRLLRHRAVVPVDHPGCRLSDRRPAARARHGHLRGHHRRVHHTADPPVLPDRAVAAGLSGAAIVPGLVRPDLRVPGRGARHRRCHPTPSTCQPSAVAAG